MIGGPSAVGRSGRGAQLRLVLVAALLVPVLVGVGRRVDGALAPDAVPTASSGRLATPRPAARLTEPPVVAELLHGPGRPPAASVPDGAAGTVRTWFAHGRWWAVLPDPGGDGQRIWGLDGPEGPWVDTGTVVDDRAFVQVEVAFTGRWLVVAATGTRDYRSHGLRIHRLSWSQERGRWVGASDHPVAASTAGLPGVRLAATEDGTAWLARRDGRRLLVARTDGTAPSVTDWSTVPVSGSEDDVGGFDLMAAGPAVRLAWRSASADEVVLARREGDRWASTTVAVADAAGEGEVDLAASDGLPGRDLLALRIDVPEGTGTDLAPGGVLLTVPHPGGPHDGAEVTTSIISRQGDGLASFALLVDRTHVRVVAIARVPSSRSVADAGRRPPRTVVEKSARLADLTFPPGRGTVLVAGVDGADAARPLVPATQLPEGGGRVLVTGAEGSHRWATWADGAPTQPLPVPEGGVATVLVDDTFEGLPAGGPAPAVWRLEGTDVAAGVLVDDPVVGGRVLRVGQGPPTAEEPPSACRPVPALHGTVVTFEALVRVLGSGSADARLLTVRGPAGSLAAVRQSRAGLIGWSTPEGRVTPAAAPGDGSLRITVVIDRQARTAAVTLATPGGRVLAEADGLAWLSSGRTEVDEVCLRPAPHPEARLSLDSLLVTTR